MGRGGHLGTVLETAGVEASGATVGLVFRYLD